MKKQKEDFRLNCPSFKTPAPETNVPMFSHAFKFDSSKAQASEGLTHTTFGKQENQIGKGCGMNDISFGFQRKD